MPISRVVLKGKKLFANQSNQEYMQTLKAVCERSSIFVVDIFYAPEKESFYVTGKMDSEGKPEWAEKLSLATNEERLEAEQTKYVTYIA